MRSAFSASRRPSSALTRAAAAFKRPSQWTTEAGIGSPETGKFSTAFRVSLPQSSRVSSLLTIRVYPAALGLPVGSCPPLARVGCDQAKAATFRRALAEQPARLLVERAR